MKILLVFFLVAVVFSAEREAEEKDVELVRSEEEYTTYTNGECKKYWEMCMFDCSCCGKYAICRRNRCQYSLRGGFCKDKKKKCAGKYSKDYTCDF
nr:venom protein [Lampona murina]